MKGIVYQNTKSIVWGEVHKTQPRGMAYETDKHFVHVYGRADGLWTVSNGLTISEKADGALNDWVVNSFGATDIQDCKHEVGETVKGVWRPGLFYDNEMLQALGGSTADLRDSEQALLLIVQKLDELMLFVEPTAKTVATHSHKARELLILACTEVETQWQYYLTLAGVNPPKRGFTTNDYVKLAEPLYLSEFEISLPRYKDLLPVRPFLGWDAISPTETLGWYDAYNKAKHDRGKHFAEASVQRCIEAVAANLVLFSVRYGPYRLYHGAGTLAALINASFSISLQDCKPTSFYIPEMDLAARSDARTWGQAEILPRKTVALKLS